MKKLFFILLLLPVAMFPQKIKTKKDRILLNEKEIGIFKENADLYTVFDLKNKKLFTAELKGVSVGGNILSQWLELKNEDGSITTEIPYDVTIASFSFSRILFSLLSDRYGFTNANGFDLNGIQNFFNTPHENISEKALQAKAEALAYQDEKKQKIAKYNPYVKDNLSVVFGGPMSNKVVGRVAVTPKGYSKDFLINVFDLDNLLVASCDYTTGIGDMISVKLFNDTTFEYEPKKVYARAGDNSFLNEFVGEIVAHDALMGHQVKQYQSDALQQKIQDAKERSVNVYNINGHLKDEKGVEYKGKITALFQKLDINNTGDIEVWNSIDNFGKKVNLTYKNEKGNSRTKTFDAKDNIRFYVSNADGTETVYQGMKVNGDSMKKLSNAMSLGFNNAYFYMELYNYKGNSLLIDPIDPDRFVIKIKSESNGQMLDDRNNDKLSEALADYLKGCKSLSNEIRNKTFDLKIQSNLETIIREYSDCSK
ncbi:MAG: hypothetical protein LBE36_01365 [Flavobacteriaceae bacterium]|jgi:hypothetical protein|nr:hypothetical protein [Flavobacteriaceae bacterium]